jgi:hypothetical protein
MRSLINLNSKVNIMSNNNTAPNLELLKRIVKECLEHQESSKIIAKEFGLSEFELDQLYQAVEK